MKAGLDGSCTICVGLVASGINGLTVAGYWVRQITVGPGGVGSVVVEKDSELGKSISRVNNVKQRCNQSSRTNKWKLYVLAKLTSMAKNRKLLFITRNRITRKDMTWHFTSWMSKTLVPRILTGEKSMRNVGGLRNWVKVASAITAEQHPAS
ncbi:hypothetical protein Tco_0024428 [Tanacetum coccineum]